MLRSKESLELRDQPWQDVKVVATRQHPRERDAVALNNHLLITRTCRVTRYDRDAIAGDTRGAISLQRDHYPQQKAKETDALPATGGCGRLHAHSRLF